VVAARKHRTHLSVAPDPRIDTIMALVDRALEVDLANDVPRTKGDRGCRGTFYVHVMYGLIEEFTVDGVDGMTDNRVRAMMRIFVSGLSKRALGDMARRASASLAELGQASYRSSTTGRLRGRGPRPGGERGRSVRTQRRHPRLPGRLRSRAS
jgi:hypothetical protein